MKFHTRPLPVRTLGLAALLCQATLTSLPAASVEERLSELETRLEAISKENAGLRQRLGENAPVAVTPAGKEKSLSIGGYAQLQAEAGDAVDSRFDPTDRFMVRRARLGVKGVYAENLTYVLQAEFGTGTVGNTAAARAALIDLYVRWDKHDFANVTVGQFKTPYGREQLESDTKVLFVERSLPSDRLTLSRQAGAMVSGEFADERLGYSAGLFNGNGVNNSANDNDNFAYVGRVEGVVLKNDRLTLEAGANAFRSADDGAFTGTRTGLGLDAALKAGRLDAGAEWLRTDFNRSVGLDTVADGWSVYAGWFLVAKTLQAVARYETYDPSDAVSGDDEATWTVGFNYLLKGHDIKFGLNYLRGVSGAANENDHRVLARMQLIF